MLLKIGCLLAPAADAGDVLPVLPYLATEGGATIATESDQTLIRE